MSEFDKYLQEWHKTLVEEEALTTEDIDELEDHLRVDFLHMKEMGLDDQDAFYLAARHLGKTDTICNEYRKVNGTSLWTRRVQWMIIGYLVFYLLNVITTVISQTAATTATVFTSGWISFIVYGIAQIILLFGVVYIIYGLLSGKEPFLNTLANSVNFAHSKSNVFLLAGFLGAILLSTGSRIIGSFVRGRMLNPYQYGTYAYGEMILNILWGLLLPTLLISLVSQSRRKKRVKSN